MSPGAFARGGWRGRNCGVNLPHPFIVATPLSRAGSAAGPAETAGEDAGSVVNYFDSHEAAARYAGSRPQSHGRVLEILRRILGANLPMARALDVGCGTGHSTVALLPMAGAVVGLDASPFMLAQACRAGTQSVFGFGDSLTSVEANFDGNHHYPSNAKKGPYLGKTTPVCKYRPNAWGIFDMHGNVWEWCKDWYGDTRLGGVDPQGPSFGVNRVRRGGAWNGGAAFCRAAFRYYRSPEYRSNHFGFRVVLVARK